MANQKDTPGLAFATVFKASQEQTVKLQLLVTEDIKIDIVKTAVSQ